MKRLTTLALLAGCSLRLRYTVKNRLRRRCPAELPAAQRRGGQRAATNLRLPRRRRAPLRQPRHRRRCGGDGPCAGYAGLPRR